VEPDTQFFSGKLSERKYPTFNARPEDIADKRTFQSAWKCKQFCLMQAAYFCEWSGPHPSGAKGKKQRWRISRADNHQLVFAGLYGTARTADGIVMSCTIASRQYCQPMNGNRF